MHSEDETATTHQNSIVRRRMLSGDRRSVAPQGKSALKTGKNEWAADHSVPHCRKTGRIMSGAEA